MIERMTHPGAARFAARRWLSGCGASVGACTDGLRARRALRPIEQGRT